MVEDSGGLRGTTEILINVTDVNDNSPTCIDKSVTVTILEGATSSNVYTPSCHDAVSCRQSIVLDRIRFGNVCILSYYVFVHERESVVS